MKDDSPCHGCDEKYYGCHGDGKCGRWAKWRKEQKQKKELRMKKKHADQEYIGYMRGKKK